MALSSFDEILNNLTRERSNSSSNSQIRQNPFNHFLGLDGVSTLGIKTNSNIGSRKSYSSSFPKVEKLKEKLFEISKQNNNAQNASLHLKSLGANWNEFLTLPLLKSEWRRLARRVHPDLNPTIKSHVFIEAHKSYKVLLSALNIMSTK